MSREGEEAWRPATGYSPQLDSVKQSWEAVQIRTPYPPNRLQTEHAGNLVWLNKLNCIRKAPVASPQTSRHPAGFPGSAVVMVGLQLQELPCGSAVSQAMSPCLYREQAICTAPGAVSLPGPSQMFYSTAPSGIWTHATAVQNTCRSDRGCRLRRCITMISHADIGKEASYQATMPMLYITLSFMSWPLSEVTVWTHRIFSQRSEYQSRIWTWTSFLFQNSHLNC